MGVLEKVLQRDYAGDSTDDREIDLGRDYTFVRVFGITADPPGPTWHQPVLGWALADKSGVFSAPGTGVKRLQASVDNGNDEDLWQGKMTGADATKVKTGTNGAAQRGFNRTGKAYRIFGMRFSKVEG